MIRICKKKNNIWCELGYLTSFLYDHYDYSNLDQTINKKYRRGLQLFGIKE